MAEPLDLSLLETFRAIAEEGSFSRAGQRLSRTQPAVSLALKRLEAEVCTQLVDRSSKALSLTDSGRLLLEYCDRFDGVERDLRTSLAELRDLGSGKLTVGANESTTLYLLEQIAELPNAHVKISRLHALGDGPPHDDLLPMIRRVIDAFDVEITARAVGGVDDALDKPSLLCDLRE